MVTTSAQRLTGAAAAPIGLASAGTQSLQYGLCYQSTVAGSPLVNFVGGGYSIGSLTAQRTVVAASASVVPGAGTWNVGFCVSNYGGAIAISNNDFVNGWVQVTN